MPKYMDSGGLSHLMTKIKAAIAATVTGVKGNAETSYRTGQVNITPANVGAVDKSGDTMTGSLVTPSARMANTYYGVTFGRTTDTPVETILYTGIKWVSNSHMPVVHVTGYAYGLQSPVEFKIAFYIYDNKIGWCGATNMGSWNPSLYLFKYMRGNVTYVAIGFKGSCYYLQLQADVEDEMGKFANIDVSSSAWSWSFLTTAGTIPAVDNGTTCNSVPYKADILKPNVANAQGTLPVANGGTGLTANPSMLTNLGSTTAADVLQASPRPGVTGTLPVANGGTGKTTGNAAANYFLNELTTGSADPGDADYYISQYAGGGTTTTTYHRRPVSALWNYIKGKIGSVLGLTADNGAYQQAQAAIAVQTGSTKQSHITLQTLMTWLITTKKYIPSGKECRVELHISWSYADNDILQFTASGVNYELQLAGCVVVFEGNATAYNAGRFRLTIYSSPADSFTAASGYNKVPLNSIAVYSCNGSTYAPAWNLLVHTGNLTAGTGLSKTGFALNHSNSVTAGTAGTSSATSGTNTLAVPYVTYDAQGHVTASGTHTHTIGNASTSAYGVTKLSSATDSTSEALAATPKAVSDSLAAAKTYADGKNNQNAFSNVKVGSTTVAADTTTDTLELAGSNVTLTPDATNDKVTIGITASNVTTALGNTAVARATADASGNNIASTYANQNAFSNVKVGSTTVAADTTTDTLELAGSNVTLTPDATNDKVTIGITASNVTTALGNTAVARATADASGNNIASTYANQNAFSNVKVGSTTVAADTATDTLELVGSNVTLTPDATNDKVTIGITASNVTTALGNTAVSNATSATSAGKLTTARTINVGNYATGTATSFDGSANITIPVNSLNTTALVEPSIVKSGTKTSLPLVETLKGNKLALLPADQIIIEKTTDGGTTWVDYGATDEQKRLLFVGNTSGSSITVPLLNNVKNVNCGIRITFTAMKYNVPAGTAETGKYAYWNSSYVKSTERYGTLQALYFWVGTNSDGLSCKCEKANGNASATWTTVFNKDTTEAVTGWSGGDYIAFTDQVFGGGTTQTGQAWNWRLTFFTRNSSGGTTLSTYNTGSVQQIYRILGYGANGWIVPNNLFGIGHLYTWDTSANAIFPASITANAGYLKSTSNGNTVTIGSANSGYCHISNSANIPFWFNNHILLENGKGIGATSGYGPSFIEMTPATNSTNNGGYIDFHYNRSTSDYTARIIEDVSAQLSIYGKLRLGANSQSSVADSGLVVNDIRNATITPASSNNVANFYFTNSGTPNTNWWSLLHVKGWTGMYNAWELAGPSHTGDQRTTPLYVRSSSTDTWGSWRQIFDSAATIPAANGGTGQTSLNASANALINSLSTGDSDPSDNDYYVSQYVNGGTTTTTFHRRPVSKLWNYIKGKIGSWMKNNTSKGTLGWTSSTNDTMPITSNTLAYWDGSYTGNSSNLTYCVKGAFGTMATKNSLAATDIPAHASSATTYGAASTSNYGHAKLSSATNSSSEDLAATPKAVKAAYDLANTANTAAGNAMSAATGALYFKITYSISNGNVVGEAHVYSKGNEVTSQHNDSCFVWSYCVGTGSWVSLGTGKTKTVTVSSLGFGGNLKCDFTPASTS